MSKESQEWDRSELRNLLLCQLGEEPYKDFELQLRVADRRLKSGYESSWASGARYKEYTGKGIRSSRWGYYKGRAGFEEHSGESTFPVMWRND